MEEFQVKQEIIESFDNNNVESAKRKHNSEPPVIEIDSSDDDSSDSGDRFGNGKKSRVMSDVKTESGYGVVLPGGFLDPLPPKDVASRVDDVTVGPGQAQTQAQAPSCKNFWKAGDFEEVSDGNRDRPSGGMDHVRVHPRFLHSNATSHKWVLGAFAELLDNSLDEYCNGATYVHIDMLKNKKDGNRMVLIEDNGGGMDPDKMRQCMSLGYSLKSKVADTIGQYGNGFKTSSMRIGADVIVFSRCSPKDGKRPTQSIGLLSYTFLRSTGKEDIVVPMVDYKKDGREWKKIIRSSPGDWNTNIEAVVQWSPFSSEADLLNQFDHIKDHGTRIIIYNLWEDDQGQLELDFDVDEEDIQMRGVNRDEKNIQMANKYPNSRHFLTYRHSLRSYASILYLKIPTGFRMILRGKEIEHHNIVNDMMMINETTYRPQPGADTVSQDANLVAVVTMGFVKDAKAHIDVQGYNVYHKNRLIKPFWRLWNSTGSDGRGVIGVLEANFVEPAHDKQGFERTIVLSRLEARLVQMQKTYWRTYCHKIGYAPRVSKKSAEYKDAHDYPPVTLYNWKKGAAKKHQKGESVNGFKEGPSSIKSTPLTENILHDDDLNTTPNDSSLNGQTMQIVTHTQSMFQSVVEDGSTFDFNQLMEENRRLKEKLERKDGDMIGDLLRDLEKERSRCKALETQIEEVKQKTQNLSKEQVSMIDIFADERKKGDIQQETLRKKLTEATAVIQDLVQRVKQLELEKMKSNKWRLV